MIGENDMGENVPLGFHPEIEQNKHTQVHDKKRKRAKVHQRGEIDSILPENSWSSRVTPPVNVEWHNRRFTRGMDVSEKAGKIRSRPIEIAPGPPFAR